MSRVGRKVIVVPSGVKVSVKETEIEVQGPKGKLKTPTAARGAFARPLRDVRAETLSPLMI